MRISGEEAEAFEVVSGRLDAGLLILCDHAEATMPPEFAGLGLPQSERERHIASDIGAKTVSLTLAKAFDCPAVLSRFSRLLIDPNRGLDDPTLVMQLADGAIIPGNLRISEAGVAARIARFYQPYDDAITRTIASMKQAGPNPVIIAMHSFTPRMKGVERPWHITVIWDADPRLNRRLLDALAREPDLVVGENEPYQGGYEGDTIERHAIRGGLAHALIEIRQDLIATEDAAQAWGLRLAGILRPLLAEPALHDIRHFGKA